MRDERCEFFVVLEKQHFDSTRKFDYFARKRGDLRKNKGITVRWALDISDFDIEIIE